MAGIYRKLGIWILGAGCRKWNEEDYDFSLATILILKHTGKIGMKRISLNLSQFKRSILSNVLILNMNIWGNSRDYQRFLLENTDLAYFLYDPENETKLKFIDNLMKNQEGYRIKRLTFEDLNELVENFSEK